MNKKMFAITGASGFIGGHLEDLLKKKDIKYIKIGRTQESDFQINDISSKTDWSKSLNGIDTIFHLAGRAHITKEKDGKKSGEIHKKINFEGTKRLVEKASEMGVKKIIFLSTAKVFGEKTNLGNIFNNNSKIEPKDKYSISKLQAEEFLKTFTKNKRLDFVIVRTPVVYGPNMKANFLNLFYLVFLRLPLPFGKISNKRSIIYVGNLVDFLYNCAILPEAIGNTFLISERNSFSTIQIIRLISKFLNVPSLIFPFPLGLLEIVASIFGKKNQFSKLTESFEIDPSYSYKSLEWKPPFTINESFEKTSKWFLKKMGKKL